MYIDPIGQRVNTNELNHHGILGMKWGIRRFQPYPKGYKGTGREVGDAAKSNREINKIWDNEIKKERANLKQERKAIADKANKIAKKTNNFTDKNTTKKDVDAYNKLISEYVTSKRTASKVSRDRARKTMTERFGEKRLDEVREYLKRNKAVADSIALALGVVGVIKLHDYGYI